MTTNAGAGARGDAATPISWQPGDELPAQTLPPVTRLQLITYAGASGDYNPIHTVDAAAAEAGLPGVIQHGMLTMAAMGRLFSPYLDRGTIQHFDTRFSGMVFVDDVLTITGRVTGREPAARGEVYHVDVSATNGRGQTVASGTVAFLAPPAGHLEDVPGHLEDSAGSAVPGSQEDPEG